MEFASFSPIAFVVLMMGAATPLLFAAIGELVVEKSGVLNLGVEGMMIVGAIAGFAISVKTGSPVLGIVAGGIGGALLALIFGVLTQYLLSNQVATGLGLTLFGLGVAALFGQSYSGIKPPNFPAFEFTGLTERAIVIDPVIIASFVLTGLVAWFLNKTRQGLILRAVGENHDAAHSLGYNVILIRICAIAFGGFCAGIGGAYLSLIRVPQWTEGMTAGAGWIALAIVVFASWRPRRAILGAYLFGGVTILQLDLQGRGIAIQSQYMSMAPYIVTIVVLVIMSADKYRTSLNAPASLGRVFHKSG